MKNKTIVSSPFYLVVTKTIVDVAVATIVACLWLFDPFNRFFKGTGIAMVLGNDKMAKGELIAPRHLFTYSWMVIIATTFISLPIWRWLDPCVSSRATVRKCAPSCKGDPDWHVLLVVLLVDVIAVLSCCIVLLAFRYIFINKPFLSFGFVLIWGTVLISIVFAIRLSMELGAMLFDGEKAMLSYLPQDVANALRECGYAVTTSASSILGSASATVCGKSGDSSVILGAQGNNVPRTLGKLVVYNAQMSNILISATIAVFIGMRALVMYLSSKRSSRIGTEEVLPEAGDPAITRRSAALDTDKAAAEPGDDGKAAAEPGADGKAAAEPGDDGKAASESGDDGKAASEPGDDGKAAAEPGDDGKAASESGADDKESGADGKAAAESGDDDDKEDSVARILDDDKTTTIKSSETTAEEKERLDISKKKKTAEDGLTIADESQTKQTGDMEKNNVSAKEDIDGGKTNGPDQKFISKVRKFTSGLRLPPLRMQRKT